MLLRMLNRVGAVVHASPAFDFRTAQRSAKLAQDFIGRQCDQSIRNTSVHFDAPTRTRRPVRQPTASQSQSAGTGTTAPQPAAALALEQAPAGRRIEAAARARVMRAKQAATLIGSTTLRMRSSLNRRERDSAHGVDSRWSAPSLDSASQKRVESPLEGLPGSPKPKSESNGHRVAVEFTAKSPPSQTLASSLVSPRFAVCITGELRTATCAPEVGSLTPLQSQRRHLIDALGSVGGDGGGGDGGGGDGGS
eukprot:6196292-Pleurochrysis_carterae.AAC.4